MNALPAKFPIVDHLIVRTLVVYHGRQFSHHEIHLARDEAPTTTPIVLLTIDAPLYDQALALEGTDQRVDAAWRAGKRRDGCVAQLLIALRPHEEAA